LKGFEAVDGTRGRYPVEGAFGIGQSREGRDDLGVQNLGTISIRAPTKTGSALKRLDDINGSGISPVLDAFGISQNGESHIKLGVENLGSISVNAPT